MLGKLDKFKSGWKIITTTGVFAFINGLLLSKGVDLSLLVDNAEAAIIAINLAYAAVIAVLRLAQEDWRKVFGAS